jgi:hypothetical protein
METREKSFILRFSLSATIPDALFEDETFDEDQWLAEWEGAIKPRLIRAIFTNLRAFPHWEVRIRNRGTSAFDEIEIVATRDLTAVHEPPTGSVQ